MIPVSKLLPHCQFCGCVVVLVYNSLASAAAPVLVLTDSASTNKFGAYATEILRGEGLMAFDQLDRAALGTTPGMLANYSAVVLPESSLNSSEEQQLRDYVQGGGVLIASRPDDSLSDVFGIEFTGNRPESVLQYFGVDPNRRPGAGITQGALQYHGPATNYQLKGASALAYLYANATTPTANPAVTTHEYGAGKAIAFAFDPAKSVVLTRQGNPAWQNTEGDGINGYRPHDFFARTTGQTYYDPNRITVPHADELQRFLANTLIDANDAPLPRMWYLPGNHKTLMINTGDGEDNFGSQFDPILNDAASYGGKFSVYLRDIGVTNTQPNKEAQWRAAGHEVGVHVYAGGAEGPGAVSALTAAYNSINNNLESKFGHISRTARSHTIDWTGWMDMARIEANRGTQLDTNFYHYLNGTVVNAHTTNGYFNGTALPQKFIDVNGQFLDIYQIPTQWPDEWFADNGLTVNQTVNIIKTMFERAESEGYYSAFVNNIHPVRYYNGSDITGGWARQVWQYCQEQGIPMWSAEMMLDFTLARNASTFNNITYSDNQLEFDYLAGSEGFDLTIMIPTDWSDQKLAQVTIDGVPANWNAEVIKGISYAFLTTESASAHVVASYADSLPADFNNDGAVNGHDLEFWQESYGVNNLADADGDGDSDGRDFLIWQQHYTASALPSEFLAVPEPRTMGLAGLAVVVLLSSKTLGAAMQVRNVWQPPFLR